MNPKTLFMLYGRIGITMLFLMASLVSNAQTYDLLIKGGRMLDPANHMDGIMDIAILGGKIAKVAKDIPETGAAKVIHAHGMLVVPGLIDIHTHVFVGSKPDTFADGIYSLSPDDLSFKSGVTTVVDAGTSGAENFRQFKAQVIDKSQTRILAFLNIAGRGLSGKPEQEDTTLMDVSKTVAVAKEFPDIIVGIKIGHYDQEGWTPFNRAVEAAGLAGTPLFVECHLPKLSLEEQLTHMRPGDIITHSFEHITERAPIVDSTGKLRTYAADAKSRGVLFDLGHGGAGFWFDQAIPAMQQGLAPNTFSTDLHRFSMNAGMKSLLNVMSKYMAMGMSVPDAVLRATWNPAKAIHRSDLGNLSVGHDADVAVLSLQNGKYGFVDAGGNRIEGKQKLEAELTIRAGKIVWDLNGLSARSYTPSSSHHE